jgi:hypothetical protein
MCLCWSKVWKEFSNNTMLQKQQKFFLLKCANMSFITLRNGFGCFSLRENSSEYKTVCHKRYKTYFKQTCNLISIQNT